MSAHTSDNYELLLSPKPAKDIQRRKRMYMSNGYLSEGGAAQVEELSRSVPVLSDHGLPSERARRAANHRYRELQRSGREEETTTNDERTPLLLADSKENSASSQRTAIVQNEVTEAQSSESLHTQSLSHANDLRVSVSGMNVRKERKQLKRKK